MFKWPDVTLRNPLSVIAASWVDLQRNNHTLFIRPSDATPYDGFGSAAITKQAPIVCRRVLKPIKVEDRLRLRIGGEKISSRRTIILNET